MMAGGAVARTGIINNYKNVFVSVRTLDEYYKLLKIEDVF